MGEVGGFGPAAGQSIRVASASPFDELGTVDGSRQTLGTAGAEGPASEAAGALSEDAGDGACKPAVAEGNCEFTGRTAGASAGESGDRTGDGSDTSGC